MTLRLKATLAEAGLKQGDLAKQLKISDATVAQIVNHGQWPRSAKTDDLKARIVACLTRAGASDDQLCGVFDTVQQDTAPAIEEPAAPSPTHSDKETDLMLLRKQSLKPTAKKAFGLFRDPFADDLQGAEDVYLNQDIRYIRETMFTVAKTGGLLAVIGESGAGKTILIEELEDRIRRDNQPIVLIKPYVLGMADNDQKGKVLRATHIAEAIMSKVAPAEKLKSSPEARFEQLHEALNNSYVAGRRHVVLIDEAHALSTPTITHLKRFFELKLGFAKLLAIILVGQPELREKLSEHNPAVREVVQRCEMVELMPLNGEQLREYLAFKFRRNGKELADIVEDGGLDAMRSRLSLNVNRRQATETRSLLYPLAVGNLLAAAMNLAAELGVPRVTADVVREA